MTTTSGLETDVVIEYGVGEKEDSEKSTWCDKTTVKCLKFFKPILLDSSTLPVNATWFQRFAHQFLCPPYGQVGAILFVCLLATLFYGVLWATVGNDSLPGGNLFSIFMLFVFCWCGGYLIDILHLPPLLGMLFVGGVLGNAPGIDIAKNIDQQWASGCRQIALAVILIRAGLGLDAEALRRLSCVVLRLAFLPCLAETLTDGIASHFILRLPWQWAFMLGFVIAAVSPAVVVPSLLSLSERGYGLDKGIPTLVIAAASVDDVLAITGFGVLVGITFSSGNIAWNLAKGPLEAVVGVAVGIIIGVALWYFPQRKSKHLVLFRSMALVGAALLCIFGSKKMDWTGAGPLAVLTLAFVAACQWRTEYSTGCDNPVVEVVGILWMFFQPLLFGLIASAVQLDRLSAETVGNGVAVLCIGLTVRCLVAFLSVFGTSLNLKERIFVPLSWLPKATVQAAIGGIAYDMALRTGDDDLIENGEMVLMLAVLVIIITAPIGAIAIHLGGPRLLNCSQLQSACTAELDKGEHGGPAPEDYHLLPSKNAHA